MIITGKDALYEERVWLVDLIDDFDDTDIDDDGDNTFAYERVAGDAAERRRVRVTITIEEDEQ